MERVNLKMVHAAQFLDFDNNSIFWIHYIKRFSFAFQEFDCQQLRNMIQHEQKLLLDLSPKFVISVLIRGFDGAG